jgi:pilus assembly protein CpaE
MIAEVSANNRINYIYRTIAMHVTGRAAPDGTAKAAGLKLPELFKKRKRA